ncbi:G-type lectin S-receptor-like serine/threonine-protein kinase RKS1 [Panicum virgatum]|uniref:G-type lectin S-receptor-like serine/threonine-protein kinase RKS1 n=1 Tax=Panicum virgatum TaxID=38727 RepID=UPI0019D5C3C8|nr:G-type lectin S-receptor-like serine/threonine-protein kinase RKS1 [Panicum virgatum]
MMQGWRTSIVLAIAVVAPTLSLFICGIISFKFIKRHRKGNSSQDEGEVNVNQEDEVLVRAAGMSSEFTVYDILQVLEATNNFSEENKLGQGGFGPVYKGRFRDGLEIAVKRLASHSGQGFREFKNEIELIAKLQHTNLVGLLGCCCQRDERLLIYEYMPNKSLDFYIFDEIRRVLLDWNKRLAIIEGIAQGILYLHKHSRLRVIHRDLKASNILLDREMNPKISDFGLAKIFTLNDTEGNTKRIVGTYGYMAPEYASEGLFSIKSDVFSFGVLILEIISGKRNSSLHQYGDFINLLGHAWQLWKDELWLQLVDTSLGAECHTLPMRRCINVALLCVQENAVDRPTMSEVITMLSSDNMVLPEPKHPAYFHVRVGIEETSSHVVDSFGVNDVTVSALHGR